MCICVCVYIYIIDLKYRFFIKRSCEIFFLSLVYFTYHNLQATHFSANDVHLFFLWLNKNLLCFYITVPLVWSHMLASSAYPYNEKEVNVWEIDQSKQRGNGMWHSLVLFLDKNHLRYFTPVSYATRVSSRVRAEMTCLYFVISFL